MGQIEKFNRISRLNEAKRTSELPESIAFEIRAQDRLAWIVRQNKPLMPQFKQYIKYRVERAGKTVESLSVSQLIDSWRIFLFVQSAVNPYVHAAADRESPYHQRYLRWEERNSPP